MTSSGRWRWARPIRLLLLLVVGVGSALAYIALAMTVNGQPSYQPFPGWVAVLQPVSQPRGDQVQLQVHSFASWSSFSPWPLPGRAYMEYAVAVCGPHPYRGELLIGGNAQLNNVSQNAPGNYPPGDLIYPLRSFRRLPHLVLTTTSTTFGGSTSIP